MCSVRWVEGVSPISEFQHGPTPGKTIPSLRANLVGL